MWNRVKQSVNKVWTRFVKERVNFDEGRTFSFVLILGESIIIPDASDLF